MGTRGAFGVVIDGVTKVTYNHSDSYLSGLGHNLTKEVVELLDDYSIDWLKDKARDLKFTPDRDPTPAEIKKLQPYTDLRVSERSTSDWYCLLHGAQGSLDLMLKAGFVSGALDFLNDSLFCEYAYIVNLDDNVFEVYDGFQTAPHTLGRYAEGRCEHFERRAASHYSTDNYYPVALVKTFGLDSKLEISFCEWMESIKEEEED